MERIAGRRNSKENIKLKIGKLQKGKNNLITDVKGVKVGHKTLDNGNIKTGVTAIIPHSDNIFREKLICSSYVINGFGKSVGLVQINELGTLETPIILTNTLSVGTCSTALVKYMLKENDDIGVYCLIYQHKIGVYNEHIFRYLWIRYN